jgi:hypothetical protein
MHERERAVATALNLGEIEMNRRERESPMGEKKESHDATAQHVWTKRERERCAHMCVRKHIICVTHFLAPDWSRR